MITAVKSKSLKFSAIALIALICFSCMASAQQTKAIVNVTLLPMTQSDLSISSQTVLIDDGKISVIGNVDEIEIPDDALRIDGDGHYLIPGLADMHVHLEYSEDPRILDLFLANGITSIRNMDGRPYILNWRDEIENGDRVGPSITTAGPILDGDPPLREDNVRIGSVEQALEVARSQIEDGYDFLKVYGNLSEEAYEAIVIEANSRGIPVTGHVPRSVPIARALESGQKSIEHLNDFDVLMESDDSPFRNGFHWSKLYFAMPVDEEKVSEAAALIAMSGVWVVPTAIQADRALARLEIVNSWAEDSAMKSMSSEAVAFWKFAITGQINRMDEDDWSMIARGRENRLTAIAALDQAGANLLVGTDTPNPFVVPGFSLIQELKNFVEAGISPGRAIQIATRDAAQFLERQNSSGTIEIGKQADLVMLNKDPLTDIENLANPLGVMVNGEWLPRNLLESKLADINTAGGLK